MCINYGKLTNVIRDSQLIHQAEARHQEVLVGIACLELVFRDEQLSSGGKEDFHFLREIGQGPHEQAPGPGKYLKSEKTAGALGVLEFKTDLDGEACGHEGFIEKHVVLIRRYKAGILHPAVGVKAGGRNPGCVANNSVEVKGVLSRPRVPHLF